MLKHNYIALDTETTGVDFNNSQVIQCGILFLNDKLEVESRKEWNVNYVEGFDWDEKSQAIHNISKEEASTHGVSPEEFLRNLEKEIIKRYGLNTDQSVHIIAANAYFDTLMIESLWRRYRKEDPPISHRVVDLNTLGLLIVGLNGLQTLCDYFSIEKDSDKSHNALYDAELHYKVFRKLLEAAEKDGLALKLES